MKAKSITIATDSARPPRPPASLAIGRAPQLSARGLTVLLALMCLVPVATIVWLTYVLPPVYEGQLQAQVWLEGVPPSSYYQVPAAQRRLNPHAVIVVRNVGREPWTTINVRINRHYQIYEFDNPLQPGEQRTYLLNRFASREGPRFDHRYLPVDQVEILVRMPDGSRQTLRTDATQLSRPDEFDVPAASDPPDETGEPSRPVPGFDFSQFPD